VSAPSWMTRLDRPGRALAPLPAGRKGYGVYAGTDRRRRPFAVAPPADVRRALSDGALEETAAGLVLTPAGRARLAREDAGAHPFLAQHKRIGMRTVMTPDGAGRAALADLDAASPLARYTKPRNGRPPLLEPVHAAAAAILVRDYERSALTSRITSDWSAPPGSRTRAAPRDRADAPVSRLDAQARVLDALAAAGPGLDRLLITVLMRGLSMGEAERDLGWPSKSGVHALRLALDRLAAHYRLAPAPRTANPFTAHAPRPR